MTIANSVKTAAAPTPTTTKMVDWALLNSPKKIGDSPRSRSLPPYRPNAANIDRPNSIEREGTSKRHRLIRIGLMWGCGVVTALAVIASIYAISLMFSQRVPKSADPAYDYAQDHCSQESHFLSLITGSPSCTDSSIISSTEPTIHGDDDEDDDGDRVEDEDDPAEEQLCIRPCDTSKNNLTFALCPCDETHCQCPQAIIPDTTEYPQCHLYCDITSIEDEDYNYTELKMTTDCESMDISVCTQFFDQPLVDADDNQHNDEDEDEENDDGEDTRAANNEDDQVDDDGSSDQEDNGGSESEQEN